MDARIVECITGNSNSIHFKMPLNADHFFSLHRDYYFFEIFTLSFCASRFYAFKKGAVSNLAVAGGTKEWLFSFSPSPAIEAYPRS
jgi:hypothetical protein